MDWPAPGVDNRLIGLGIALALGLLIGLEREWADDKPIGIRSFGLIGLLGGMAAMFLDAAGGWPIVGGLLALTVLFRLQRRRTKGLTTLIAGLVAFMIGAAAVAGHWLHATVIAGASTLLLHWKEPMHGMVARLGRDDLETIARFVLITLVILPVLPDTNFGPYQAFNPFNIWLLVVLIVTINLAGYVAFRFAGPSAGGWLAGLLGGLISSTATTFSYANLSRRGPDIGSLATLVILVASTVVYARILLEVSVVAPGLTDELLGPCFAFGGLLLLLAGVVFKLNRRKADTELPDQANPAQIRNALTFAGIYAVVLFAVAASRELIGDNAVFSIALISGLTDVDALTLSVSRLFDTGNLDADTAWRAIFLASLANLTFKSGIACVIGSATLRRMILRTAIPAALIGFGILFTWP